MKNSEMIAPVQLAVNEKLIINNEEINNIDVGADTSVRPISKRNTQKGITLLALIITIIVLLILAMVSIKLITNHDVIEYAKKATSQYGEEQNKEKENLDLLAKKMSELSGTDDNVQPDPDKNHEEPKDGDKVTIGDFCYSYDTEKLNGWECYPLEDKESYGKICATVYGKPVLGISFEECEKIKITPYLPQYIDFFDFKRCTSLATVTNIPDSVTVLENAFLGCTLLKNVPTIPSGVKNMRGTFEGCTSLTGTIVINANISSSNYEGCFKDTVLPIELTGSCTMLNELAATATNNNITVK